MKNHTKSSGIILTMLFLVFVSCQRQLTEEEFHESLTELRGEMQIASTWLEEAIETDNLSEFMEKSDEALNKIETQLDAYMDETDRAFRRIHQETRTQIINIKQKITEIDFRLALLENNEHFRRREQAEDDELPAVRRTRPLAYQFPHIPEDDERVISERIMYGEEVLREVKVNLLELQREVDQFIEHSLVFTADS